jgi:hypothetical protein
MTMAPLGGIVSSAAGAPLSQTTGSEAERLQKDNLAQTRQLDANGQAERAAGIGQTEQDQQSSERDADGRRLWEAPAKPATDADAKVETAETILRQSKDASGQSGTQLDLTG